MKQNQNLDPSSIKKWLAVIIAVLSALAGAITENVTSVLDVFIH